MCFFAQAWEGLNRIATSRTPFVYRHLLAVMIFAFVFSFPFAYVSTLKEATIPVSFMMCLAYYGVNELSHDLENPLGWHDTDLNLEDFQV